MVAEAMGIMVKVLILPGGFSRHGIRFIEPFLPEKGLKAYSVEPVLPSDQYRPTMVGYVPSLDLDQSEIPPPRLSCTVMIDANTSF